MTIKAVHSVSSLGVPQDESKREDCAAKASPTIPKSVADMWDSLAPEVRAALLASELKNNNGGTAMFRSPSLLSFEQSSSTGSDTKESEESFAEKCPVSGADVALTPVERAPRNVFAFTKTHEDETTASRGWRNVFAVPVSYDVNMVAHGSLFDASNSQLLVATGVHPDGYNTRFAVVDAEVNRLYGDKIGGYFEARGIELTTIVINGGEADKRKDAVDAILDALCAYKLRRREPFLAIGGGCVLDIAGMAACLYRRGVPFVRVPTTLLAIVDASVGVKNGVDYYCAATDETYKNRVGSFYAPYACLLDPAFIASQDQRNVSNGMGEIMKLALVRSPDLFELLEAHGRTLVETRFEDEPLKTSGVTDRIIDASIQIMLEELGPNLWEAKLDRCVDYGHTFSKLLEMVPGADIFHGEAVNVDGFFCVVISHLRGYIDMDTVHRILECMKSLGLPTNSPDLKLDLAWQSCKDAIEHRHGEMRIPLITEIGDSVCANDITEEELERALDLMAKLEH